MSARVIAFINFKGGVGKTAGVINIGAALARYHEKRVLVVDLDAQCNASLWLLKPDQWREHAGNLRHTTYQIFQDAIQGTAAFDFERAVIRGVPRRDLPLIANLDVLPASVQLLRIEETIHQNPRAPYYRYLHKALAPVRDQYDYLLIDCPPNLYSVTKNALFAADYSVVPYIPDYLSLSGFQILAERVEDFYGRVRSSLSGREKPWIAAVLISHYKQVGHVFSVAVGELEKQLDLLREASLVHPRAIVFQPYIRYNVAVAESTNEHLPVVLHQPGCIGAQDYADLAQNFLTHFEKNL